MRCELVEKLLKFAQAEEATQSTLYRMIIIAPAMWGGGPAVAPSNAAEEYSRDDGQGLGPEQNQRVRRKISH